MLGRMYTASFEEVAVSAIQDLFELNAPSDSVVVIHKCIITQESDAGDAEAEMLRMTIQRAGTSGSAGSTATARPHHVGDAAFGGTVEVNNTTQAGTLTVLHAEAFNVQLGWIYDPSPEERIIVSPSGRVVFSINDAPADALTMSGILIFEEIGG